MSRDILMPRLGQAMMRGQVVEWRAESGDQVTEGAHLLTIESDKFTYEIEAPATGLLQRLVDTGAEADVGTVLGRIGASLESAVHIDPSAPAGAAVESQLHRAPVSAQLTGLQKVLASPKAKAVAAGRIDLAEVAASRPDKLIVAADVDRAIAAQAALRQTADSAPMAGVVGGAMDRLQRSWQQAPHFVQMVEVDASAVVEAQKLRKAGRFPVSLNDILIHAAAQALAAFPAVNAHIVGGKIVRNQSIDISLAVATDRGLRTPALRDVGGQSLEWVAQHTKAAIDGAKNGFAPSLRSSLTISNLGAYGIRQGTPVLNLDESVLIFAGAITEIPVIVDGKLAARPQMTLSIAYDHRVVDGLQAAQFSSALRDRLEQLDLTLWRGEAESKPEAKPMPERTHERNIVLRSDRGLRCDLSAAEHRWTVDEPVAIGGDDSAPDPVLQVLGALLSCLTIAFKVVAAKRRVPIERIAGAVSATPATGKVKQVRVRLDVWSGADTAQVEALLKSAKSMCYVHDLLRPDLDLAIELAVNPKQEVL